MSTSVPVPAVVAEILAGDSLSVPAVCDTVAPKNHRLSKPVAETTVMRWITRGVLLGDGTRLRLEAAAISGRWITSRAALGRFIVAQTPPLDEQGTPSVRPWGRKQRDTVVASETPAAVSA